MFEDKVMFANDVFLINTHPASKLARWQRMQSVTQIALLVRIVQNQVREWQELTRPLCTELH